jgi:hypothetical protein
MAWKRQVNGPNPSKVRERGRGEVVLKYGCHRGLFVRMYCKVGRDRCGYGYVQTEMVSEGGARCIAGPTPAEIKCHALCLAFPMLEQGSTWYSRKSIR